MDFPAEALMDALFQAGVDSEDSLRTDYSGRGMCGENCWGFVGDDAAVAKVFAHLGIMTADGESCLTESDVDSLADRLASDSMGRGTIFYFPGVTFTDAGKEG